MRSIVEIIAEIRKLQARVSVLENRQAPEKHIEPAEPKAEEDPREKIKARWLKRKNKG